MTPGDLAMAAGLLLLLEGAAWCLFPGGMRRLMAMAAALPDTALRSFGLLAAAGGFLIIAAARL